jgi:hypothetical protein
MFENGPAGGKFNGRTDISDDNWGKIAAFCRLLTMNSVAASGFSR